MTNLNEQVHNYTATIEEAISEERPVRSTWKKVKKAIKVTAFSVAAVFALLVTCLIVDISNDTPEERAAYEQPKKVEAKKVLPQGVKVAGTQSIDYKRATLRQILSQQYPMVSAYEVKAVKGGTYNLENVDPKSMDSGDFTLDGEYQVGDVVVIMWANDGGDEVASSVKLASAGELDIQWNKGGNN
ncbi:hypothetical protein [Bacillus wiedmannii]|uniref:hypothetical protein n=1 Tax=Bacillus wiedmannii TaxID=1890302 RepID=UPI000BF1956C|nr:hypothetical protein [Bacillus wiedmannii]PEM30195.1 hypothetical protein CN598_12785 [Bacillus wiedmannii]